jgi:hypothetical protein
MRRPATAALALLTLALAQTTLAQTTLAQTALAQTTLAQTTLAQTTPAPATPDTVPETPAPAEPEAPPPNPWLPRPVANLIALDKISARATPLAVKVGQSATFGSLTISVRACVVRPPDQAADAAAFLDITDAHGGMPAFHGWMILSDPSLAVLQHPVYGVRLSGCSG